MTMASPHIAHRRPARRQPRPRVASHPVRRGAQPSPRSGRTGVRGGQVWAALITPFFLLLFFGLLLIWLRVAVSDLAVAVARAETQKRELQEQNTRLLVYAEQLGGYGRIAKIAREQLHMTRVATKLIVVTPE